MHQRRDLRIVAANSRRGHTAAIMIDTSDIDVVDSSDYQALQEALVGTERPLGPRRRLDHRTCRGHFRGIDLRRPDLECPRRRRSPATPTQARVVQASRTVTCGTSGATTGRPAIEATSRSGPSLPRDQSRSWPTRHATPTRGPPERAPRPIPAQPGWAAISAVHWVNPSTPPRRAGPSQRKGSSTAKSSNDPVSQQVKLSRVTRRSTRILTTSGQ